MPNENTIENARTTALECAACKRLLGTTAPVPAHDLAWCGCGSLGDCDGPAPGWIECETTGLAGFRLFRKAPNMVLAALKNLGLVAGKAALGFAGGCLLAILFAGAFATTAALAPKPASLALPTAAHVVCK